MTARVGSWFSLMTLVVSLNSCGSGAIATSPSAPALAQILIHGPIGAIVVQSTYLMQATGLDSAGHAIGVPSVVWTSSDPSIATISSSGLLTSIHPGHCAVMAQAGQVSASEMVVVTTGSLAVMHLSGPKDSVVIDAVFPLNLTALDAYGDTLPPPPVVWSTSNPYVAAITPGNQVYTSIPGRATITARSGSIKASIDILVRYPHVAALELDPLADSMAIGRSQSILVIAHDSSGATVPTPAIVWKSSSPSVATVDSTGLVSGVATGSTVITARFEAVSASLTISIMPVLALGIFPAGEFGDTLFLSTGQTLQLTRYEFQTFDDVIRAPTGVTTWTSSAPGTALVSSTGLVTAGTIGVAAITASVDNLNTSRPVKVVPATGTASVRFVDALTALNSITLIPNAGVPLQVPFGAVQQATFQAGSLQVIQEGITPFNPTWDPEWMSVRQFLGFLPSDTHATIVITGGGDYPGAFGNIAFAPLWDWTGSVPADSVRVRLVLATDQGYNVYFTPPGAPISTVFLQGCYLDWPFGYTNYAAQGTGAFDIVLQPGKGFASRETIRVTVTPQPGKATTYILTGHSPATFSAITLIDN